MPTAQNSVKPELSAAELELKRRGRRRLIGAVTMGIVAIVVLPMIFDSEPKRKDTARQEIEIQIPPKEGLAPLPTPVAPPTAAAEVTPKETPKLDGKAAPDVQPAKAGVASTPPPPTKPVVAAVEPVETKADPKASAKAAAKPDAASTAKTDPNAEKKPDTKVAESASAKAATGGFVIQIGAFKDAENAKSIVSRMKDAKLPVFTDSLAVKTGTVTRVRVGPFATKEKAESALAEVKLAGVDGKVVPLP